MSSRTSSDFCNSTRDVHAQSRQQLRGLIAKTLVYFAERETDNLRLVREHLLYLMDARPSPAQGQNLRSAYILLDKQADVFNRAYRAALQATVDEQARLAYPDAAHASKPNPQAADSLDSLTLALVDVSEVNRVLQVDRVAQRFNTHYDSTLSPLTQRLGVLQGLNAPELSCNPFRPEVFVRAFILAWESSGLDNQATEDLLLSLDPRCAVNLAPLYGELDKMLATAGVAAQPALRIRKATGQDVYGGAQTQQPASEHAHLVAPDTGPSSFSRSASQGSAWGRLAPVGRNLATQAREFLQKLGLVSHAHSHAEDAAEPFTREHNSVAAADSEFMGYLGDLQAGAGASSAYQVLPGQDPADHNILRQMRDLDQVRRAPELDRGTVDALAEVFDYVFADQAIPVQMKFVIGRLQIPVLKAAMIDRDFFLSADHPARRLVDTLAHASIAWAPEKGENDPLYVRIETTVKRVLNEFEDDLDLFSELLLQFTEFLFESEQQAQGRIEPEAVREQQGESADQARTHADAAVHARISVLPAELPLAPFLAPFLTSQWREVLARAWQLAESEPQGWDSALSTMDQLIWSTQPKTSSEDRRKLVAVLPDLVRNLNTALDSIHWNGPERALFTKRLISTHMLAIRMTQPPPADAAGAALEAQAGTTAMKALDERMAGQLSGSQDAFDAAAQSFTRGLWFDFQEGDGRQHRCRLSWVSPMRTRLLFTNRDGFDAFVRTEREVAALLRLGRLRVIDAAPVVSRALDHILAQNLAQNELELAA